MARCKTQWDIRSAPLLPLLLGLLQLLLLAPTLCAASNNNNRASKKIELDMKVGALFLILPAVLDVCFLPTVLGHPHFLCISCFLWGYRRAPLADLTPYLFS